MYNSISNTKIVVGGDFRQGDDITVHVSSNAKNISSDIEDTCEVVGHFIAKANFDKAIERLSRFANENSLSELSSAISLKNGEYVEFKKAVYMGFISRSDEFTERNKFANSLMTIANNLEDYLPKIPQFKNQKTMPNETLTLMGLDSFLNGKVYETSDYQKMVFGWMDFVISDMKILYPIGTNEFEEEVQPTQNKLDKNRRQTNNWQLTHELIADLKEYSKYKTESVEEKSNFKTVKQALFEAASQSTSTTAPENLTAYVAYLIEEATGEKKEAFLKKWDTDFSEYQRLESKWAKVDGFKRLKLAWL